MKRLRAWALLWWRYHRHGKNPTVDELVGLLVEVGELTAAEAEPARQYFHGQVAAAALRELGRRAGRGEL